MRVDWKAEWQKAQADKEEAVREVTKLSNLLNAAVDAGDNLRKEIGVLQKENKKLAKKGKKLRVKVQRLEDALVRESKRAARCMDVTEDAASALGNMGRVAFRQLVGLEELTGGWRKRG